ncbi:MAG: hypothetical protein JO112_11380 [Planctomycetes bacterium]|nr:hypothetical protein [Planctomycetota bacterium]
MTDLWPTVVQLFRDLGILLWALLSFLLHWVLVIAWLAWWLWGVNWKKVWPLLASGGWVAGVLLMVLSALVWSQMVPGEWNCFGLFLVANFWWQLGVVCLVTGATLLCGWLQGVFRWTPAEIPLEAPVPAPAAGHDHH